MDGFVKGSRSVAQKQRYCLRDNKESGAPYFFRKKEGKKNIYSSLWRETNNDSIQSEFCHKLQIHMMFVTIKDHLEECHSLL